MSIPGVRTPTFIYNLVLSITRNWWQRATESRSNPPSPVLINKQVGKDTRRKFVVRGMMMTVVGNSATISWLRFLRTQILF